MLLSSSGYNPWWAFVSFRVCNFFLWGGVVNPMSNLQPGGLGSLFVWDITFDLSGMGSPPSSYAMTSIAFRIVWPSKCHHHDKARICGRGWDESSAVNILFLFNMFEWRTLKWFLSSCGWTSQLRNILLVAHWSSLFEMKNWSLNVSFLISSAVIITVCCVL